MPVKSQILFSELVGVFSQAGPHAGLLWRDQELDGQVGVVGVSVRHELRIPGKFEVNQAFEPETSAPERVVFALIVEFFHVVVNRMSEVDILRVFLPSCEHYSVQVSYFL